MSTIKTETLSTPSNATVPVDTVVNGTAKAWVNFNGTGTVAIRRAFNVSSITDLGTGNYTVNFTNAMSDANYAFTANHSGYAGSIGYTFAFADIASALRILTFGSVESGYVDPLYVTASVLS